MCIFPFIQYSVKTDSSIIGIPSGEVFEVNELQLYNLYENDLIRLDFNRGFWVFKDETLEKIKLYLKC